MSEPTPKTDWRPENDGHIHKWTVVACDGDRDIEECCECGKRVNVRCSFDEEFS